MSDAPAAPAAQVPENGAPPATQEKEEAPGFKVFAGNLAYSTTDEGLKAFFAPVQSDILSAQVILRGTRSAGYGFVALATDDAAKKAVETLHKQELGGRQVIIEIAKPTEQKDQERKERKAKRKPGRRGSKAVPGEVSEAEANGEATTAEDVVGPLGVDEAAKPKKKKKNSRKSKAAKATAAAESGETDTVPTEGETTDNAAPKKKTRKAKTPRPAWEAPAGEPSPTMLFVANLGFNIDDEALKALFTEVGIETVSARIVRRRFGQPRRSKGYGFVDVGSETEQKKAIAALEGKEVGGRNIAVKIAVNPPRDDDDSDQGVATSTPVEAAPATSAPTASTPTAAAPAAPAAKAPATTPTAAVTAPAVAATTTPTSAVPAPAVAATTTAAPSTTAPAPTPATPPATPAALATAAPAAAPKATGGTP